MLGELVVDVEVLPEAIAAAALADGSWYGVFPDPTGGCLLAVVAFDVGGEE